MPTLVFSDDFSEPERRVLRKTFSFACRKLGIEKDDASIFLKKGYWDRFEMRGQVCALPDSNDFIMELSAKDHMLNNASAMIHETCHVKQHLRGELRNTRLGAFWKGAIIPHSIAKSEEFYKHLPWEVEAFNFQNDYDQKVWGEFDLQDNLFIASTLYDKPCGCPNCHGEEERIAA